MRPLPIVLLHPLVQIGLQLLKRRVEVLAERNCIKLVLDGAVEAFADPVGGLPPV